MGVTPTLGSPNGGDADSREGEVECHTRMGVRKNPRKGVNPNGGLSDSRCERKRTSPPIRR